MASRHPLASLVLVLPMLAVYEGTMLWLTARGYPTPRTGLDVWLHDGLSRLRLPWDFAPSLLMGLLLLGWAALAWRRPLRERLGTLLGMGLESVLAALALWALFFFHQPVLRAWGLTLPSRTQLIFLQSVSYLGAAVFEETVFRLLLFSLLTAGFGLAFGPRLALGLAVATSALIFAAAHHLGPDGESWNRAVFLFRVLAGVYFALLFQFRGFGVAVGAHAVYNVLAGLAG